MGCIRKIFNFQQFQEAIFYWKRVLYCEGYDYVELPNEIIEAPSCEPNFTSRMKMLSRNDGFMM